MKIVYILGFYAVKTGTFDEFRAGEDVGFERNNKRRLECIC